MGKHDYEPNAGQGAQAAREAANEMTDDSGKALDDDAGQPDEDALRNEIAALNDRFLRLAAELENTRRRAEREKADAGRYAIASFARDLLGVSDNFERALATAPDDLSALTPEALAGILEGVRMTERELAKTLERHGVRRIDPLGEKFDPNLHQAVAQAPAPGVPAGAVAAVAQPGYVIGDRVLRAAMVVISTGEAGGVDTTA